MENKISVIVPTYNRSSLLRLTLLSLSYQTLSPRDYEVIVVDDGSSDDTAELVTSFKQMMNLRYYFQPDEGFRVARARNIGLENCCNEVCLFLDSGVVASPGLLEKHLSVHSGTNDVAVIGFVDGFTEGEASPVKSVAEFSSLDELQSVVNTIASNSKFTDKRALILAENHWRISKMLAPWVIFWGGHISCLKRTLISVDGFDENFRSWGGEDVELGIRLHKAGVGFASISSERVVHLSHATDIKSNLITRKENAKYINQLHPGSETELLEDHNNTWQMVEFDAIKNGRVLNSSVKVVA